LNTVYEALKILGAAFGVESQYTDNWGKVHRTELEMIRRILEAKGVRISREHLELNPQTLVACTENLPTRCRVYLEGRISALTGDSPVGFVRITEVENRIPAQEYQLFDQAVNLEREAGTDLLTLSFPFPSHLPAGRYSLTIEASIDGESYRADCRWVVCPPTAYLTLRLQQGRGIAGIGVALYGVRSETNWGVGDCSDLKRIVDWAVTDLKVDFIGLNPLHALFNTRPFHSSPYLPSSRLYRNFIYLDVTSMPDFVDSLEARSLVNSADIQRRIRKLRDEPHVNYEEVSALKLRVLKEVFRTFMKQCGTSERWQHFENYRASEGSWLERFATFCALTEHFRSTLPEATTWRQWPAEFHDPCSEDVSQFRKENEQEVFFRMYVQWQLDEQLREVQEHALRKGMSIGLYHDVALAVDRDGADFWAWKSFFCERFKVGAPPDAFAPGGQDWGFPPPNSDLHRASGYELFLKMLEANCKYGGALRIDHVMQLHHLFWIPEDGEAREGAYVKDYEDELLKVLCLASQNSQTVIVGEDLGTVPPDFRERLMASGIMSYRLFYFERDFWGTQRHSWEYPRLALVSVSTHDLPTLVGFWCSRDILTRRDIGQLDDTAFQEFQTDRGRHKQKIVERLVQDGFFPEAAAQEAIDSGTLTEDLHQAVLRFLLSTPSALVIISQEDLFLDERQQNFPGTTWQNPNWVTKMRYSVEELTTNPDAIRLAQRFRRLLEDSGRAVDKLDVPP
jgi:4-alpha-glucanotransferase